MPTQKRIIFLTYRGAELLDMSGPAGVFSTAGRLDPQARYQVITASSRGGLVPHSCETAIDTVRIDSLAITHRDTVLVLGGYTRSVAKAASDDTLIRALRHASQRAGRYGSICTGAFLLSAAGLLTGRQAATHWAAKQRLERANPDARVDGNRLYVTDGQLWTSAGVTTGIDMALAMLETDHGPALKAKVARQLVVYSHRPGNQSQFSDLLEAQSRSNAAFEGLVDWLSLHLSRAVKVNEMAERANMSPRSFQRKFTAAFGLSPARFHEQLRLDKARDLIEAGEQVKAVISKVGFQSPSAFRSAFKDRFGITPRHCAQMTGKPD